MFCTTCGRQIPDGTAFCPNCGSALSPKPASPQPANAAGPSAQAAPTQPAKQKKEPGKVRKFLFGSLSVGAIITIILVTQIAKYLAKQGIETVMNPEPAAVEQQGEAEDGISIEDMENSLMEKYKDAYDLTDCTVSLTDSQIQIELISSVTSDSPEAAELSARFQQDELSEASEQDEAQFISELEQESGTTGITEYVVLYYADDVICGEVLYDSHGIDSYYV